MALPKKTSDPVLTKLAEAHRLMREAHEEMSNRVADPARYLARNFLSQSMQILKRAADYEKRAV